MRMPFHSATEIMAALLRSARLLKFSPSGLLQTAVTRRNGAPLSRLYSGALGGRGTGVCPRQSSPSSGNVSSRVWPYAGACVRNYALATEKKDESGNAMRHSQALQFELALNKLDNSVRRTGRITKTHLLRIFYDTCRRGYPSGNQALLLLRSCGSLLPEVPLEERTELAHRVWEKLEKLGAQYDVSHYNALLKVYLQNEFKFSPTDFLATMEAANVQPNRVTYQRLIAAYCHNGDIEGASTILSFMKSKDLPITEAVFNSLVTGHARAGDVESAKNILTVMQGAGIEPGPDTYLSLLNAHAEKGDMDSLKQTMEAAESADCSLLDRDIMQVIHTLAKAGHQQHIPYMVECLRHERGFIPDAMNLCLSLITQSHDDIAFSILKKFPILQSESSDPDVFNLGNFFLRHCVTMDTSVEKMFMYCKELQESNLHTSPMDFTLFCALEANKIDMSLELMKLLKEQNSPIKPHYFWPILTQHLKVNNTAGVVEVMKAMQSLKVFPDTETLSNYVLPAFPDMDAAREALKDAGVSLESRMFVSFEARSLAAGNLAELYTMLSDTSCPTLDLSVFRSSLILGFIRSSDMENMVKITELLYNDERFSKKESKTSETVSYFLYNLINQMSEEEVQKQEDKLRTYFNELHAKNITISINIYRGMRNLLESYKVPQLIKHVLALVDLQEQASLSINGTGAENRQTNVNAEDTPFIVTLKKAMRTPDNKESLARTLELKLQHEKEMTPSCYAILISLCCRNNDAEEALNLKKEMSRMDPSAMLDSRKYIALVKTLTYNDRVDEAVDILTEMKEKEIVVDGGSVMSIFHLLNDSVPKGVATVRRLQETIFSLGLTAPSSKLCSPLVSAYLHSDDLSGALDAVIDARKLCQFVPPMHNLLVRMVEKGETDLLKKAMDFLSQVRGEMTMLFDLFFAFLQTGRYREARKIVETPGLRAKPLRLLWFAEKCIETKAMEALEHMVDLTDKLFDCDRDEMYSYILRLCKETNDWQKAEAMWTKMQEENVIPRERTLRILAEILKSNGQKVPFEVAESWFQEADVTPQVKEETTPRRAEDASPYWARVVAQSKKGEPQEAYKLLKEAIEKDVSLDATVFDQLIRSMLAKGCFEDAMEVKDIAKSRLPAFQLSEIATNLLIVTQSKKGHAEDALEQLKSMLQEKKVPSKLAITRLVQAMGSRGDATGIQEVQSLIKNLDMNLTLSTMVFINNTAIAHIKNGDLESAVDGLEAVFTSQDIQNPNMSFVLRKVLEDNDDKAWDKLSIMAERLANQFACYKPASQLFLQLLDFDKIEDAKFMLARCNAVAQQEDVLISYLSQKAQIPGQAGKIKTLLSLIPDFTGKDVLYSYLMKSHVVDGDLSSAKALQEHMQKEGIVMDELSLKRLAQLYRKEGETVPFTEPPESFKFYADLLKEKTSKAQESAEA
ncbi:leucine-rich PPR motif-containing protein, mitochondrial [Cottoperca gobio]|uniref:Leucine-rich PPR motif-containing protein, mitochondrial n=1 Tax=Cottoperca gobio TaxID=56716 RepID=A0A6J2R8L7_COTGO|nr:leucine-rich PPR motif-containing protein, mitochondrial [Cottoperca gobio]